MSRKRPHTRAASLPARVAAVAILLITAAAVAAEARTPDLDASGAMAYCQMALEIDRMSRPANGYEVLPNDEQYRIAKQLADIAKPMVEALDQMAPHQAKYDTGLLLDGVKEVARTGDFRILGLRGGQKPYEDAKLGPHAKEVATAITRLHAFDVDFCDWKRVPVLVGDDFFQNMPPTIDRGLVSFEFANRGAIPHEMNIQKLQTDARIDTLLHEVAEDDARREQGPPTAAQTDFRPGRAKLLGEAFAPAGKDDYIVFDLDPGRYVLVCFVPDGTTYESEENETLGGGTAHILHGMIAQFEVH